MGKGHKSPLRNTGTASMPLEQWPAVDRLLYEECLHNAGPYGKGGRGAGWRSPTRMKYVYGYGRWLSWLSKTHGRLLSLDPSERVSQALVEEYRLHLAGTVKPMSVVSYLCDLGSMLCGLYGVAEFSWVHLAAKRLARKAAVRNKRGTIPPSADLADLGFALMKEADNGKACRQFPPALRYRNGLMIALLAYWPIRRRNLAMIEIGRHLTVQGDSYRIDFAEHETKQKKPISFVLPSDLVFALKRYLEVHRPVLMGLGRYAGRAGNALWVGWDGDRLNASSIYQATKNYTKAKFGRAVSPHRFRDAAATTIATEDPAHVRDIIAVLGHSSMATSERHYNQARSVEAGNHYHRALQKLRGRSHAKKDVQL